MFDRIGFLFVWTLLPVLIAPALFPSLRLTFFAPFLVILFYKRPYLYCLWFSVICGIIVDLLSAEIRFGLHAVNYSLTAWLVYTQKRHFFEDNLSTVPLMSLLFAVISTIVQVILLSIFDKGMAISWSWVASDIVIMPILDALYAFVWFTLPVVATTKKYA